MVGYVAARLTHPTGAEGSAFLAVLVITARHFHAQFLDLAGQGVAAPAQQHGSVAAATSSVLEGSLDHDPLKGRDGAVQQARLATTQRLIGPLAQSLFPVGDGRRVLLQVQ